LEAIEAYTWLLKHQKSTSVWLSLFTALFEMDLFKAAENVLENVRDSLTTETDRLIHDICRYPILCLNNHVIFTYDNLSFSGCKLNKICNLGRRGGREISTREPAHQNAPEDEGACPTGTFALPFCRFHFSVASRANRFRVWNLAAGRATKFVDAGDFVPQGCHDLGFVVLFSWRHFEPEWRRYDDGLPVLKTIWFLLEWCSFECYWFMQQSVRTIGIFEEIGLVSFAEPYFRRALEYATRIGYPYWYLYIGMVAV